MNIIPPKFYNFVNWQVCEEMSLTPKKHKSSQFEVASSNELKTTFLALFLIPGTVYDKSIMFPHVVKV